MECFPESGAAGLNRAQGPLDTCILRPTKVVSPGESTAILLKRGCTPVSPSKSQGRGPVAITAAPWLEEDDMPDRQRLGIYLNDHLAGAIAGTELAKRSANNNKGSELGEFLSQLAEDIDHDRRSLEHVMKVLDIKKNPAKEVAAWLSEKAGRLKLNGQVIGYSDLSKLVELEALSLGVKGKQCLWQSLKELGDEDDRIDASEVDRLIERALSQAISLEEKRTKLIGEAFSVRGT